MKGIMAVLLAVCMILVMPAYAVAVSDNGQNFDPVNVKGKGVDVGAVDELISGNSSENSTSGNETFNTHNGTLYTDKELSNVSITDDNSINTIINSTEDSTTSEIPNQQNLTETTNEPVTGQDNDTENFKPDAENETITAPVLNTTGIVMQTSNYTCGPAALATVLQNMGFNNITEEELINLSGTDASGTTLYGLVQAAQAKGLSAAGMKLSVDELKKNNIVFVTLNGEGHYSVVRKVTENSVYLADPSLGNIEMSREKFSEIYTGNALVISDPKLAVLPVDSSIQTNETSEQTNSTSVQPENQTLTSEEMQTIRGRFIPKILAAIVVALKVAVVKAVKKLSLKQLGTLSRGALEQHMKRYLGWLPKIGPYIPPFIGATVGIDNYRRSTPAHKRTYYGYVHAAFRGGLSSLLPW